MQNFQKLAEGLPYAKHMHSRLVCAITKELMNENNPPMVLPSGTVYSEKAIQEHTSQGAFIEPSTGETLSITIMINLHQEFGTSFVKAQNLY